MYTNNALTPAPSFSFLLWLPSMLRGDPFPLCLSGIWVNKGSPYYVFMVFPSYSYSLCCFFFFYLLDDHCYVCLPVSSRIIIVSFFALCLLSLSLSFFPFIFPSLFFSIFSILFVILPSLFFFLLPSSLLLPFCYLFPSFSLH